MASVGQIQRQRSKTGKARTPDLSALYRHRLPDIHPESIDFRLRLYRYKGAQPVDLDPVVTSFTWADDATSGFTGNLQCQRQDIMDRYAVPIARLQRVQCSVHWAGRWYWLWEMRTKPPQTQTDTGVVSVDLEDDVDLIQRDSRHWVFRKTKRNPYGWFAHDVAREVCRADGVPAGQIAQGTKRLDSIDFTGSGADAIRKAYEQETQATKRKFVLRIVNGRVCVLPFRRNSLMYLLSDEIRTALTQQSPKSDFPVTVITGTGQVGKGKDARKVRYTDYRRDVVRRYGYSHKDTDYGTVSSYADLVAKVQRDLAEALRFDTLGTIGHSIIPFIRRGDGVEMGLRSEGFTGRRRFVYTTACRYSVNPAQAVGEWDITSVDPYADDKSTKEKLQRASVRKARASRRAPKKA